MSYLIRPMLASDLATVVTVQADAYAEHFLECHDVIAERFNLSPATAWVAEYAGEVRAYLVCYCSHIGKITPFNSHFAIASEPDCLYLHDLAIATSARGAGLARRLVAAAESFASQQALVAMGLIAVQGSSSFWGGFGFEKFAALDVEQQHNLCTYTNDGVTAVYMVKNLKERNTEVE